MLIRILSEWSGSPRCGAVADVPDPIASERIRTGWAEAVTVAASPTVETAMRAEPETAMKPRGKGRR